MLVARVITPVIVTLLLMSVLPCAEKKLYVTLRGGSAPTGAPDMSCLSEGDPVLGHLAMSRCTWQCWKRERYVRSLRAAPAPAPSRRRLSPRRRGAADARERCYRD